MNRTKIKNYAPQARRDFIQAVSDRAAFYGLTEKRTEPVTVQGDLAMIAGRPFPKEVAGKRKALQDRVERDGYEPTMEALAYTWFNRLVAIRYMELHGYLEHGYRVLSNPDPARMMPEVLEHAEHVELPGLSRDRVIELKLDGTKEAELYRMLLVAQCNALHSAMPFLFERIGDETELVLPESLLHSDSIVRKLVSGIDEEDWQEVEIIGWLYQFYTSEKKEQVIGKVVASEDIPAATQLFTPNWIVKYLLQNSLGRRWMTAYPQSSIRRQMEYYVELAEQTPEVQEQLKAITSHSLNPEEMTLLDPACGSGHILVEGYDLFKAIYQERGYRAKDIPRLILEKNVFGLEIDDRAAQLAAFALMMKARADDRRIFESSARPHVISIQGSSSLNPEELFQHLKVATSKEAPPFNGLSPESFEDDETPLFTRKKAPQGLVSQADISLLTDLFREGKTLGSLIRVSEALARRLPDIADIINGAMEHSGLFGQPAMRRIQSIVDQAIMLARRYDVVVANPPYMGRRNGMNEILKKYCRPAYPGSNADMFAMFIERDFELCLPGGYNAMVTMQSWMFLSTYQGLREFMLDNKTIVSLAHLENNVMGIAFGTSAGIYLNQLIKDYQGKYVRIAVSDLCSMTGEPNFNRLEFGEARIGTASEFKAIPGSPIAYWTNDGFRRAFKNGTPLRDLASPRLGLGTNDNSRFLRLWFEVSVDRIRFDAGDRNIAMESGKKWFPYNKGGAFRKWYGNNSYVINWENDGAEIKDFIKDKNPNVARSETFYFKESLTWTDVSSSNKFAVRQSDRGFIFDTGGSSAFPSATIRDFISGLLCSSITYECIIILNPTMHFQVGNVGDIPVIGLQDHVLRQEVDRLVKEVVEVSRADWDDSETSWNHAVNPILGMRDMPGRLSDAYTGWKETQEKRIERVRQLEETNNRLFVATYGLDGVVKTDVATDEVTLYRPNREEDIKRIVSYAVGCMMGRYSLDKPGLIFAQDGNVGFDPGQYKTFPADPDGILPVMEGDWFADDATNRFVEFLGVAWPRENADENVKFVADALGPARGEQPRDTIRRYLATGFYKHHLQSYKRRPIYWLFSSGKQRAFQCLVYLHRYHEGTLSRMRTEYVIPLQGKLASRIDHLASDIQKATSTSHRKKLTQERDSLLKQQAELQAYDEKLRHYADMRIALDLDDGVKVNYGKFGDMLAEVKAITGGREED